MVGANAEREGYSEIYGGAANGLFMGLNGSNTDTGLALHDAEQANGKYGEDSFNAVLNNPPHLANRTRGTNAADQEIVNVLLGRDLDTLDWRSWALEPGMLGKLVPTIPLTGGDQDMPTWWWTHNKSRYLWVGFGSSGSSRNNFFPASTNPNDGHWSKQREGDFQDLDIWLNSLEAPKFVGPPIDQALAEQGAVVFHQKDLWKDARNADIPRPPTNGSCAGCHGAYSPRYSHRPGFLPDSRLAGMSGYTVPLEIIGTDPEQSNLFSVNLAALGEVLYGEIGRQLISYGVANSWFSYPDARPGYRLPEQKIFFEEAIDDFFPRSAGACMLGTKGGYVAQPLHGVWASAPYLHNGSLPTVWDVLDPANRAPVWRRQQVPQSEATPQLGDRGFDTVLERAYDYQKLGWKIERLDCFARTDLASLLTCAAAGVLPSTITALLDYLSPPGPNAVNDRAIYNTSAYSKSNRGHEFTKVLSDAERRALIEYLKTL